MKQLSHAQWTASTASDEATESQAITADLPRASESRGLLRYLTPRAIAAARACDAPEADGQPGLFKRGWLRRG